MSEPATLTGPGNIGDINVVVTIVAVPGPSGAYYNLEYKIAGATPEDAAKLCAIKDIDGFLNTKVSGLPPGVDITNADYLKDKFGGDG